MKEENKDEVRCRRCNKKLKNPIRQSLGIGKKCEEKELSDFYKKNQLSLNLD